MLELPSSIRYSSLVSDPEAYIKEMFLLHPDAKHDKLSGEIEIRNEIINSSFKYQLLEDGLFLFSFSSYSPVDAEYEFLANLRSDYFTLVFYFTEERSKNPLYLKTAGQFYSNDRISMFFNGKMTAEFFIKAKQKAFGLRLDIHKKWITENLDTRFLEKDTQLLEIINFKKISYLQLNCDNYQNLVKDLILCFDMEANPFWKLQQKNLSYALIQQYFTEIVNHRKTATRIAKTNSGDLKAALNYMEKSLHKVFPGNPHLAELCNISESSFNKKFKTVFRNSPAQYFKELKMKESLRLLQLGQNVKDIAYAIGYKDTSAFGRAFKQFYGKSPASYVKK